MTGVKTQKFKSEQEKKILLLILDMLIVKYFTVRKLMNINIAVQG